nr:MAG TPA: hypothetical protein [Caudoviricetes sp.]
MTEYVDESAVLRRALDTYGPTLQIAMVFEEMSELQKELRKLGDVSCKPAGPRSTDGSR